MTPLFSNSSECGLIALGALDGRLLASLRSSSIPSRNRLVWLSSIGLVLQLVPENNGARSGHSQATEHNKGVGSPILWCEEPASGGGPCFSLNSTSSHSLYLQ